MAVMPLLLPGFGKDSTDWQGGSERVAALSDKSRYRDW